MTAIQSAQAALTRAIDMTRCLARGEVPAPLALFDCYRDLLESYTSVAQEQVQKFDAKESAYLNRKIACATQYIADRAETKDGKKVSTKDAEMSSLLAIGEECKAENESAVDYQLYEAMMKSLNKAIDYIRSLSSFSRGEEGGYHNSQ